MSVLNLFQAIHMAFRLYKLDLTHVESYAGFSERFLERNSKNSHWTERQIREAYDLWRRDILKKEVRKEFEAAYFRDLMTHYLKGWPQRLNIISLLLLVIALIFPPYYINTGDQSMTLGFGFAFAPQIGRIDSFYLACEIIGIAVISWFAHRLAQVANVSERS